MIAAGSYDFSSKTERKLHPMLPWDIVVLNVCMGNGFILIRHAFITFRLDEGGRGGEGMT